MEKLSRPRPGSTWGVPTSEATRPTPHRPRDEVQQRRLRSPRPDLDPSRGAPGSPGRAALVEGLRSRDQVSRQAERARAREARPKTGVRSSATRPSSRSEALRSHGPRPASARRGRPRAVRAGSGCTMGASDRSRSRGAGASRGWRRGASESGLRAGITSFQDRGEPSRGAREGGRGEGNTAALAVNEGACTPAMAGRAPSPSERESASRGLWRSARGVGHNGKRACGRGDAVRLPARSSSRGERVAGRQRTSRDSGSSTAQAETRRTSRPAAGCNRPATPGWSKPSRRGGTAKAERDPTCGSVGPKGAQVPGSGHPKRVSVERRGVSEPQERRARAQRGSSALKGRSSWRGPALDPSGDRAGRPGKTSRVTRLRERLRGERRRPTSCYPDGSFQEHRPRRADQPHESTGRNPDPIRCSNL
jgi:hypothetical protein